MEFFPIFFIFFRPFFASMFVPFFASMFVLSYFDPCHTHAAVHVPTRVVCPQLLFLQELSARSSCSYKSYLPVVLQFRVIARDLGALSQSTTASVVVTILRNTGRPAFVNAPSADVIVSEGISVLDTIVSLQAVDSDPDTTPNGRVTYIIVSPVEARALFQIDPETGDISARVSLTTAPLDVYRVGPPTLARLCCP